MTTTAIQTAEESPLVKIVTESGLEPTKADIILTKFQDFFAIASEMEKKAKTLLVTDAMQTEIMKEAREARLILRQKRIDVERIRKELKEQSLREGKAIDGVANVLKGLIEPIEDYLEQQENFVEIRKAREAEERQVRRTKEMMEAGINTLYYNLKEMPEDQYQQVLASEKKRLADEKARAEQAEKDRIEKEKQDAAERERLRVENERLKKEAEERDREAKAEREKQAAQLREEQQEKERLRNEIKVKEAEAERERKRVEREQKKARSAPDRLKLMAYAEAIQNVQCEKLSDVEAIGIFQGAQVFLIKATRLIRERVETLE